MKNVTQENKLFIIKMGILLILSNILTFLIVSEFSEINIDEQVESPIIRPNYIEFEITATSFTPLSQNTAYCITNKDRSIYIPNIFIVSERTQSSHFLPESDSSTKKITISINKEDISKIIGQKELHIYPNLHKSQILSKFNKGESLEINF